MKEVKNITVLGAGAMGATIAAIAAEAGYKVTIRDIDNKFLDRHICKRPYFGYPNFSKSLPDYSKYDVDNNKKKSHIDLDY